MSDESKTAEGSVIAAQANFFNNYKNTLQCLLHDIEQAQHIALQNIQEWLNANAGKPINLSAMLPGMREEIEKNLINYVAYRTFLENNGVINITNGITPVDRLIFSTNNPNVHWNDKKVDSSVVKSSPGLSDTLNKIKLNAFFSRENDLVRVGIKRPRSGGGLKNKKKSRSQKGGIRKQDIKNGDDISFYHEDAWHLAKVVEYKKDEGKIKLEYTVPDRRGNMEEIKVEKNINNVLADLRRPSSGIVKGISYLATAAFAVSAYKGAVALGASAGIDATIHGLSAYSLELLKSMNILKPQCNGMYDIAKNVFFSGGGTLGDTCSQIARNNQNKIGNLASYISGMVTGVGVSFTPSAGINGFLKVASGIESMIDRSIDRSSDACDFVGSMISRRQPAAAETPAAASAMAAAQTPAASAPAMPAPAMATPAAASALESPATSLSDSAMNPSTPQPGASASSGDDVSSPHEGRRTRARRGGNKKNKTKKKKPEKKAKG